MQWLEVIGAVARLSNGVWRDAVLVGIGTFFIAIVIGFVAKLMLDIISSLLLAFALLLAIIFIGVIFDTIGVAAAAADEAPLHAKASKKLSGANHAILLVRNADRVANFCNDVVGDICGTISGAIGASIAIRLITSPAGSQEILAGTIMTGIVAALTVGGKAIGKTMAIKQPVHIIWQVGRVLAWLENKFGLKILAVLPRKGRRP